MKGKYTTKKKFLNFIDEKSRKKISYDEAIVDGKYFSREGIMFKIKIYSDGSLDLDEIETSFTTEQERKRYLDSIQDLAVTEIRSGSVVDGIRFKKIDSDDILLLLVETEAPYRSKVSALLNTEPVKVNKSQKEKLDQLLGLLDLEEQHEEQLVEQTEQKAELEQASNDHKTILKSQFDELMVLKKQELERSLDILQQQAVQYNFEEKRAKKMLVEKEKEIDLIKSRIKALGIKPEPNGYQFTVSQRKEEKIELGKETEELIRAALTKTKKVDVNAFMKLFEQGEYHINVFKDNKKVKFKELASKEAIKSLIELKLDVEEDTLIYRGEMDWHQLVNYFVESGFEQIRSEK